MPKSGTKIWKFVKEDAFIVPLNVASVAWSVKTPDPETDIELMPPSANSVLLPELSLLVTSTASSLRVIDVERSPATVVKVSGLPPFPTFFSYFSIKIILIKLHEIS